MAVQWKADPRLQTGGYFYDDATGQPLPQAEGAKPTLMANGDQAVWNGTAFVGTKEQAATQNKASIEEIVKAYEAAHGARQSAPSILNPTIKNTSGVAGAPANIDNPNPTQHFTFADQSTLDIDSQGNVVKTAPAPKVATTPNVQTVGTPGTKGGVYTVDKNGQPTQIIAGTQPDPITIGGVGYVPRDKSDPGYNANDPSTWYVAVTPGSDTAQAQAQATLNKTLADLGYVGAEADALKAKTPAEVQQILAAAGKSTADTAKVVQDMQQAQALLPGQLAQQGATLTGTQATTAGTQATTAQTQAATARTQALQPGEVAQQGATLAGTQATTAGQQATTAKTQQGIQQANAPTVENIAATSPYIYQRDPNSGALTPTLNLGYQPKTTAEVVARVGQLQSAAQQQRDQLLAQQQSGQITADVAAQKFDQWWSQNVEPQKAALDAAQRSASMEEQRQQQEQSRANLATAQTAGSQAITAMTAQMPYMVGPGFGAAMNNIAGAFASGKAPQNLDLGSAVTFQMPDVMQLAQKATDQALAHISPTAANNLNTATGPNTPNFNPQTAQMGQQQPMDMTQALNATNYRPGSTTITVNPNGGATVQTGGGQQQQQQQQPAPYTSLNQMPIQPNPNVQMPTGPLPNMLPSAGPMAGSFGAPTPQPVYQPPQGSYGALVGGMPTYRYGLT